MSDQPPPPFGQQPVAAAGHKPYLERRPALIPLLLAALLALVGSSNLPYDYYVFLRCVLTVTGVFVIVHSMRSHRLAWLGVGIPAVILWAPAVFIPLAASVWKILDVIFAITFVVAGLVLPSPDGPREDGSPRWKWWKITLVVLGIGWLLSAITVYASGVGPNDCVQQSDTRASWCE